ncbi:hypothetical protein [Clostridium felsineum]|uniref:hypothetical protein n=1 Tax=Clostridium felsineum TaxID=36839 RepID=UPI00098C84ED|nr:hypothetical protein [Clostridium felsineum]URZ14549.1 hypothetical protein CLFE_005460 [Clostridium felsineum DSM 794]
MVNMRINVVNQHCEIDKESQYFTNKNIFETPAFTVYFTYDGDVNISKYGGDGYYFELNKNEVYLHSVEMGYSKN